LPRNWDRSLSVAGKGKEVFVTATVALHGQKAMLRQIELEVFLERLAP
jgi:hypothetical protein